MTRSFRYEGGLPILFKALCRFRGCSWPLGTVVAAALVLLHLENNRAT